LKTLDRLLTELEFVGSVLQERDPRQFTEQQYRALILEPSPRSEDASP